MQTTIFDDFLSFRVSQRAKQWMPARKPGHGSESSFLNMNWLTFCIRSSVVAQSHAFMVNYLAEGIRPETSSRAGDTLSRKDVYFYKPSQTALSLFYFPSLVWSINSSHGLFMSSPFKVWIDRNNVFINRESNQICWLCNWTLLVGFFPHWIPVLQSCLLHIHWCDGSFRWLNTWDKWTKRFLVLWLMSQTCRRQPGLISLPIIHSLSATALVLWKNIYSNSLSGQ